MVCKYFLPFHRLPFYFVDGFLCCAEALVWCSPTCLYLLLLSNIHQWTNKENVVYTYSGTLFSFKKKNQAIWETNEPEDIMLSEVSQHRRTNTTWSHWYEESIVVKVREAEGKRAVAGGWGLGKGTGHTRKRTQPFSYMTWACPRSLQYSIQPVVATPCGVLKISVTG